MMTHLRLWSKEWFDWKTAKSNFQIMVSKSTGRSNSVQQTRLATKTNLINFNLAFKIRSNFQTIFRQILKALTWELSNKDPKVPPG